MTGWLAFMEWYYSERSPVPGYDNYEADRSGNIFKNGSLVTPFNSSGYKQICLTSPGQKRVVKGVHQVVSMTFDPNYYDGCIIHHKNENKHDNHILNLKVESRSDHSRHHVDANRLANYVKEHGSPTKGMKMSDEFREHCKQAALKRIERNSMRFAGNQFVDAYGSKKPIDSEKYKQFCERCRESALKRHRT